MTDEPVLILQHLTNDGPAYLGTWLAARGVPAHVVDSGAGRPFPKSIVGHRALAVLGGAMSANDPLPSLRRAESLIRQAVERDIPVIGHCLGGQLMARALGAAVSASRLPEIGWQGVGLVDVDAARDWFGAAGSPLTVFQWHVEAFDLPVGATRLVSNAACPNQAFSIGPHLAMQFHVELDAAKLNDWLAEWDPLLRTHADVPSVHDPARMREDGVRLLAAQQRLADRIYSRWLLLAD